MDSKKKLVISSGFNKSHLISLAGKLNSANIYDIYFISSLYPKLLLRKILTIFSFYFKSIARFLDRNENINEAKIYSIPLAEFIQKLSLIFQKKVSNSIGENIETIGINYYASKSINILKKVNPDIYHFRSCYGLKSLDYARSKKLITICDHSSCHPRFLWTQLYLNKNCFDPFKIKKLNDNRAKLMSKFFRYMEYDLIKTDNILVNSDLVKKTCIFYGIEPNKIKVIYNGCDDKFLSYKYQFQKIRKERNNILYVGAWIREKGVVELSKALVALNKKVTLTIVGSSFNKIKQLTPFIFNSKVNLIIYGYLERSKLAEIYSSHQIFLMTSHTEGSARVVFEALASGCFIITSNLSGTIVRKNENGFVVEAGNIDQIKKSLLRALEMSNNEIIEIMLRNFFLVRSKFTYTNYIKKLHNYYQFLDSRK